MEKRSVYPRYSSGKSQRRPATLTAIDSPGLAVPHAPLVSVTRAYSQWHFPSPNSVLESLAKQLAKLDHTSYVILWKRVQKKSLGMYVIRCY